MPTYKKKVDFFETTEGQEAKKVLRAMVTDAAYNTESSYSANDTLYPDNVIPFVNKHMEYLRNHPATNPRHYIANLRLMTRKK
jgi:hypothetical protein